MLQGQEALFIWVALFQKTHVQQEIQDQKKVHINKYNYILTQCKNKMK